MHKINRLIADLLLISYLSSSALLWCLWSAAASYSSCAHPLSHLWRLRCRQAGAVGGSGCYVLQSEVYLHCPQMQAIVSECNYICLESEHLKSPRSEMSLSLLLLPLVMTRGFAGVL